MKKFIGKSVVKGIVSGTVLVPDSKDYVPEQRKVSDVALEISRFREAREKAADQLTERYNEAFLKVGEENALIFDIHKMMLEDEGFIEAIEGMIATESINAEYAVYSIGIDFSKIFSEMDDEYMKERSIDILDISRRVVRVLENKEEDSLMGSEPCIVFADDLTPSETIRMDKSKVLAFATVKGSLNSHTAILARALDIPALVGVRVDTDNLEQFNGKTAIVDGVDEVLYLDPTEEVLKAKGEEEKNLKEEKKKLLALKGLPNVTKDGRQIKIFANIGSVEELSAVLESDAGGIGLFRSEFLYLGRTSMPCEEDLYQAYKAVIEGMQGKTVVIRTLDIGADKKVDYMNLEPEENPALGFRAIRLCFEDIQNFKYQLRAIFRASVFGSAAIMFPMIISLWEVQEIKKIVEEVKKELKEEGIAFGEPELGIMIETPAAAILSDVLAKEVDFFSIGTNDLTQYTLAIDRQNEKLDKFYNPHHEAVLRLIEMTAKNAHANGIWVGICGELGADVELTERFLEMGIDELSVSPSRVLSVRAKVREI